MTKLKESWKDKYGIEWFTIGYVESSIIIAKDEARYQAIEDEIKWLNDMIENYDAFIKTLKGEEVFTFYITLFNNRIEKLKKEMDDARIK